MEGTIKMRRLRLRLWVLFLFHLIAFSFILKYNYASQRKSEINGEDFEITTTLWIPLFLRVDAKSKHTKRTLSFIGMLGIYYRIEESVTID